MLTNTSRLVKHNLIILARSLGSLVFIEKYFLLNFHDFDLLKARLKITKNSERSELHFKILIIDDRIIFLVIIL